MKIFKNIAENRRQQANYVGQLAAINKSQAVIEFSLDGKILTANENFLGAMGYNLSEIVGQHHSIFVDVGYKQSMEYKHFWDKLGRGEYVTGQYKRIAKGGREVWIQASYNPIMDENNKPFKVVKYATDITEQKLQTANYEGQLSAINKSQAVIEFTLDGKIITANDNFLKAMGYSLDEVKGQHHSMFVDMNYRQSLDYRQFWDKLGRGEYDSGQYKRLARGGREIWIQASYNPIMDANGKPYKVVKYATDITEQKMQNANYEGQISAINRSQAVIEFTLDGKILNANENFLQTVGYSLDEIKGRHHSMFVDSVFKSSDEYRQFWISLSNGEYQAARYQRIGKGGRIIWIEASYNPIMDMNGKPYKVVKYATDITSRKEKTTAVSNKVNELVNILSSSATELQATAQTLAAGSEETKLQTDVVTTASDQLNDAINEISQQLTHATQVVSNAVSEASNSQRLVGDLVDSANAVGKVTDVISKIADQTNLLALNATIEAARVGDAGKGFAVVASEVKGLATETSRATGEIDVQIKNIQTSSDTTAMAINKISDIIAKISEISTSISGAVVEQSTATGEVSQNIMGVKQAAEEAGKSSHYLLTVANELAERASELQTVMTTFIESL